MAESEEAESLRQLVPGLDQLEPGDGGGEGVLAAPPHQHQGVGCHTQQPQQRRHLPYLIQLLLQLHQVHKFQSVLRIHGILVWIRIRGYMPLTNGAGSGSKSCNFRQNLQGANKIKFKQKFFLLLTTFLRYIYIIFQR